MTDDVAARPGGPALTGLRSLGALLVAAVGAVLLTDVGSDLLLAVFGLLMLGVGLVSLAGLVLERRWSSHRPGAVLGTAPDGRPATVLPRTRLAVALPVAALAALAVPALIAATVTLARGEWLLGVLLLAVGGWLAGLLLPVARGRVTAGGVHLTEAGITSGRDGASWQVDWDDVAGVLPGEVTTVVLRPGAGAPRASGRPWLTGRKPAAGLTVQARWLAVDAQVLVLLLTAYLERPDLRAQLGTTESLRWAMLGRQR